MRKIMIALLVGVLAVAGPTVILPAHAKTLDTQAAYRLGVQAYLYAYPLVLMQVTRQAFSRRLPINRFRHAKAFPPAHFRRVVRPNVDTLYSSAWLDLSDGPILMSVPDTHGRYYLVQMLDAWTETFAVPGARTTGTKARRFAIVGPQWQGPLPAQATAIKAPTNLVWLIGRIQTNGPSDYANVRALQQGFRLDPLGTVKENGSVSPASLAAMPGGDLPPPARVAQMETAAFFSLFAESLKHNPPHAEDAAIIALLEGIGLVPGWAFDYEGLDADTKRGLESAVADAKRQLYRVKAPSANGWASRAVVGRYGTDYPNRAIVARWGLGAPPKDDAVFMSAAKDTDGFPLNGADRYSLHFPNNTLPPARAFWSLTLYGSDGYFAANGINRFSVGSRDPLSFNTDGSLDIYIGGTRPPDDRTPNWLPAPEGTFSLMLRLYWPKPEVIAGHWMPPGVQRSHGQD